jgi:hypothetical protein
VKKLFLIFMVIAVTSCGKTPLRPGGGMQVPVSVVGSLKGNYSVFFVNAQEDKKPFIYYPKNYTVIRCLNRAKPAMMAIIAGFAF